ncbi:MAG: DUF2461 domain-containing protein [Myxococcales bacterium]|nr:DUF2461 domain-containing protein [Myxococcales bacterium]
MPKAPPPAAFTGFSKSAPAFFHELAIEMNREWFLENKARYEAEWVRPMQALLDDVRARLVPAYKPAKLGEAKVMRIHRDVRFAKDKTPYKTHIGAVITVAGKKVGEGGNAAMYVHLGTDEEFVGVGTYMFDPERLARWRTQVAGKAGVELATLIAKARKAGYEVGGHDDYKKVPKGFAPDHPRAELLKLRGLTAGPGPIPRGLLHKPALADWLVEHGKALAPLVRWLNAKIG